MLVEVDDVSHIQGVIVGTFDGRRGWLHRLAVAPAHRRGGIASRLVTGAESRLAMSGAARINLLVMPDNLSASSFWRRLGYESQPDVVFSKPTQ